MDQEVRWGLSLMAGEMRFGVRWNQTVIVINGKKGINELDQTQKTLTVVRLWRQNERQHALDLS